MKDSTKILMMKVILRRLRPWCLLKCRDCSAMKTEKECLYYQEMEAVCDFNLQRIFVLSQTILSELSHNLMISFH